MNKSSFDRMQNAAVHFWDGSPPNEIQVLVTQSKRGTIETFGNNMSRQRESLFLQAHTEALSAILCMFRNGQLDVPSLFIRQGLIHANSENAEAIVFLQGNDKILFRRLSDLV